ncbi:hypothetical protein CSOJ01_08949 [Colletotrichum sojae]|uniref:Uncharacterized protein n=1 Tax=Colletotrichum sojae TaxID=2175907 RepID=A0A8H6J4B1_9PEZI|nr:hypothetical protein CSOJ01_08949 [Colletotrichum sojae]
MKKPKPREPIPSTETIEEQLSQDKDRIEQRFRQDLRALVRNHEKDHEGIVRYFLTRAAVTHPKDHKTLKPSIRSGLLPCMSHIRYTRDSLTVGYTAAPSATTVPPSGSTARGRGPELPGRKAKTEGRLGEVTSELSTPRRTHEGPPTGQRRKLPSRPVKSHAKRTARKYVLKPDPAGRIRKSLSRKSSKSTKKGPAGGEDSSPRAVTTALATRRVNSGQKSSCAFKYKLKEETSYYILECPTPDCGFVFSRHPFDDGLAVRHFGECGVQHGGDEDIVRRLACRLVPCERASSRHASDERVSDYNRKVAERAQETLTGIPDAAGGAPPVSAAEGSQSQPESETSMLSEIPTVIIDDDSTIASTNGAETPAESWGLEAGLVTV